MTIPQDEDTLPNQGNKAIVEVEEVPGRLEKG
jgi:hypothetical protein